MTHRQFMAWQVWLSWQHNRPDRTDYYLMQIACEVRRIWAAKPDKVRLDQFKITFEESKSSAKSSNAEQRGTVRQPTRQEAAAFARARWLSRMTLPVRRMEGAG